MDVRRIPALFEVLASRKDFRDGPVGNPTLNRLGLHLARISLSDACLGLRRRQLRAPDRAVTAALAADGVVVVPDFLPPELFAAVRAEVVARVAQVAAAHPYPSSPARGFGERQPFDGGFDRYDGGTLNRFSFITDAVTPATAAACRGEELARACEWASGFRHAPERFWIYETLHGVERRSRDLQKVLHRDTFHSTVKLWLFLDAVREEDGPFVYVPGSHRMNRRRYTWEYARARAASAADAENKGGAFRADPSELADLGLPEPRSYPVAANTLILADVRGFHRRGDALPGARRLALYASLRKWPFSPVPY